MYMEAVTEIIAANQILDSPIDSPTYPQAG
jgi:hypothetical protein